jgi:hypothetical protein
MTCEWAPRSADTDGLSLPFLCRHCGHGLGRVVLLDIGEKERRISAHVYLKDGLRRLSPDAADGLPRFGLRRGAHLGLGKPNRRSVLAGIGGGLPVQQLGAIGTRRGLGARQVVQEPPHEGDLGDFRFYAYCVNCGAQNLVDTKLRGSE